MRLARLLDISGAATRQAQVGQAVATIDEGPLARRRWKVPPAQARTPSRGKRTLGVAKDSVENSNVCSFIRVSGAECMWVGESGGSTVST